jgi:GGDEF domain-containing protein
MVAALLEDPITIDGTVVPLGISVGHAVFPLDGHTIDELLHEADLRMYEIKASRRSSAS